MNLEDSKTISDILTSWISVVALILGGGFAIYQYLEKERGDKVKETLNFVDRFNKAPFTESRRKLASIWDKYSIEQNSILGKAPFSPEDYNNFSLDKIRLENLGPDISLLIEFYETLEVCIKREICDAKASVQFFQADAKAFYNQHYSKISLDKATRSDKLLANELEQFLVRG